jgi:hypothetical protein
MNISPSMTSNLSEDLEKVILDFEVTKSQDKETLPVDKKKPEPIQDAQLREALFFMQDLLERSLIPFMVLGAVGRQIVEQNDPILSANKIELGILKNHYTESGKSILWALFDQYHVDATDEESDIALEYKGVPVFIKIIKGNYPFFVHPNTIFFYVETLDFPNPFDEYWKVRKEIE